MKTAVFLFLCLLVLLVGCGRDDGATAVSPPDLSAYPWVYLRGGEPLAEGEATVTLLAVGDVMLGRGVLAEPEPLASAVPWLNAADVTLGNLEGVITDQPPVANNERDDHTLRIMLTMPPTAVFELQNAGFDLLGLANNHSLDLGTAGVAETAVALEHVGITPVGLQTGDSITPTVYLVNGVRLAFFAFNAVPDPEGTARCQPTDVAATCPVDLTAYSLGNFVFDQETAVTENGLALLAYFDAAGLRAVQALPVQAGLQPRLQTSDESATWLASLLPPPPRTAFACTETACQSGDAPTTTENGQFYSGQIDLTGDGKVETIRREGERISIYEGGTATSTGSVQAVWQSPTEWRVVDVELGDPNDDGRYEIMLAIWRRDGAGHERSQPYIVGHRGGEYILMWGGRPVVDPIQELALADVDGDGIEELVVIIEQADGLAHSVAVWQWQGWSFSLQWQSAPGKYEQLVIIEEGGERPLITVINQQQNP